MNNLELKEIFINENKLDLESTTVWEQWIKDNADNGASLKENNNILFRDMIADDSPPYNELLKARVLFA